MKIPQWIFKTEIHVRHPADVLGNVARVLDIEASYYRKERNTEAARALKRAAASLREVAGGKTYGEAFEIKESPAAKRSEE